MNHLPLIIKREYLNKVRNKSFLIMTVLSPVLFIILISVVAYLSQVNNDKARHISVLDESNQFKNIFVTNDDYQFTFLESISLEESKALSYKADYYGLLYVPELNTENLKASDIKFFSEETPSLSVISSLERRIEKQLTELSFKAKGLDIESIKASKVDINISQENFVGQKSSKIDGVLKLAFGGAAGYLLFMFIIIYGNMIMRSVIEEKTSRIIEVIISSVKPTQLLLGKIIGTSLAGITQFTIWIILGSVLLSVFSFVFGIDLSQTQTPQQTALNSVMQNQEIHMQVSDFLTAFHHLPITNLIIAFVMFFICGYLLYSSIYAAIGAAVDNETDTQQFMLPVLIPLILAVYIGFFTVIENPHGSVSTLFSFIPFTSPVVMLMRIPFGVPIWQQILSLMILIITFLVMVWFAAKIYRIGILMYGKKPSYKELLKWIKY